MFSAMLTDAFQDGDHGIPIRYRFDGKLFNLRRLQAKSKVQTEVLDEFLFADELAKGAPTEEKMQKGVDQISDSCDSYDLTISIKKTKVVYQLELCTLMMKPMSGLPKLVQHLADYVAVFGIEVESDLTQSWNFTDPWCCQHY